MVLYGFVWFGRNSEAEFKTNNEWKRLWSEEWKRLWSEWITWVGIELLGQLKNHSMGKFWDLVEILKFVQNSEILSKLWNLVKIGKCWLTLWNLVWIRSLESSAALCAESCAALSKVFDQFISWNLVKNVRFCKKYEIWSIFELWCLFCLNCERLSVCSRG